MSHQPDRRPSSRHKQRPDDIERKLWIAVAILILVVLISAIIFISQVGGLP